LLQLLSRPNAINVIERAGLQHAKKLMTSSHSIGDNHRNAGRMAFHFLEHIAKVAIGEVVIAENQADRIAN